LIVAEQGPTGYNTEYISLRDRKLTSMLHTPGTPGISLSPNGKWLAYFSEESGRPEVYVTSFPAARGKWQVSSDSGTYPQWSKDGKQLYFVNGERLNVVDVREAEAPQFSAPRTLPVVIDPPLTAELMPPYTLALDGRIITTERVGDVPPSLVHLITNWKKLLPR
jgi:hypothetical protein